MNQEIKNIENNLQLKYNMLKNGSQQEIDSLFEQMKSQYEIQYDIKEREHKKKISELKDDIKSREAKMKEKLHSK